ncbi:MAG: hypothetical protein RhofKO_28280 [Rhodothermales bacterium]
MYRFGALFFALLAAVSIVREAEAQSAFGVEWQATTDTSRAFADFEQMRQLGFAKVRTSAIADSLVWQRADSLGLLLLQEVNIDRLSTAHLLDTLEYAREVVLRMAFAASASKAVPYIGLARHSDTTDPEACAYFEALAETVAQWTAGRGRTYYLTSFIDDDVCHEAVDFVLLDALNHPNPPDVLARWRRTHPETPVGLGRLGWRLEQEAQPDGWKVPHTQAWQAHRMRAALDTLTADTTLAHAFLYRWRDADSLAVAGQRSSQAYGLYDASNMPRRTADIVQRFLTDQPRVFAYPAGTPPSEQAPFAVLTGWLLVLALGIGYAQSTTFQQTVQRYFSAHSFYQEAVVRSRDLSTPLIVFFAVLVAIANGLTLYALLAHVEGRTLFWTGFDQLPTLLQRFAGLVLNYPLGRLLLFMAFTLGSMLIWAMVLSGLARNSRSLPLSSALYLILWPRWLPTGIGILAAMLLASGGIPATREVLGVVVGLWVLTSGYAFARTLADYTAVVRPSFMRRVLAVVAYPPLLMLVLGALWLMLSPQWDWIWHLMTRR